MKECCTPYCPPGVKCGNDGCGGSCGYCESHEYCTVAGQCRFLGWENVTISSVTAPDRYTVQIIFSRHPGNGPSSLSIYSVSGLSLNSVVYDSDLAIATIITEKQKLGWTYEITIDNGEKVPGDLTKSFLSAESAKFWATDFSDFSEYQLTANRAAVGENVVIYIEEGENAADVAQTRDEFDNNIYPTLTSLYNDAPDFDGNGKILILGLDGGGYYGGYFDSINTFSNEDTMAWWEIHSNEMDMVYINVDWGTLYPTSVVPHEFSHLLYNEGHDLWGDYWAYHDEGLAECAVHAVYGPNNYAIEFYLNDYSGLINDGLSLVNWIWGEYSNYAQAYLFWSYIASRLQGIPSYGNIFNMNDGDPDEVNYWISIELGSDFPTVLMENLIANWVQNSTGIYGYNGFLSFAAESAPLVPVGTTSVDLEPYSGVFFKLAELSVIYPLGVGASILYAGIDDSGNVDLDNPFYVENGVLLAFNSNRNYSAFPGPWEHSGPDFPAIKSRKKSSLQPINVSPAWLDPPPHFRWNKQARQKWHAGLKRRIKHAPKILAPIFYDKD
jgi:hypothetical protein